MNAQTNTAELQNSPLFKALLDEKPEEFQRLRDSGESTSFEDAYLRGLDLRKMDLRGLNFRGAYLRNTDLRGLDLRETCLEGASIREAKLSGVYFSESLTPQEIMMSHTHGTRLRYAKHLQD